MDLRLRLLPTVITSVTALVLVCAGSIFALNLLTAETLITNLAGRLVVSSLNGLELALRGHLDAAKFQAQFIADEIRSGSVRLDDHEVFAAFATGTMAAAPQISALVVADTHGNALRVSRKPGGDIERNWLAAGQNAQIDAMIAESRPLAEPYWGQPVYGIENEATFLNLRVPIRRGDEYLGFVGVGISTVELSQLALDLSTPPRSTVFVLYGPDKVLGHMHLVLQTQGLSVDKPLLAIDEIVDPVIRNWPQARPFGDAGFEAPQGTEVLALDAADSEYLVISKMIDGYGEVPLTLGAYGALSQIGDPFRTYRLAAVIGGGLLVLAVLLSILIGRAIMKPIRQTAAGVSTIASLEFDDVSPLRSSWIKEIDDLALSFNAMLVGLKSFERYVPRSLVKQLIRDNRVGAGTEERDMTVMFTDIVGFTPICEGMSAAEVASFVNHHLTVVSECIESEGGTIDKFIGDAVMAFWGAPERMDDAPGRACRAGGAIVKALAADNEDRAKRGLPPVRIRIGIHSGPLVVGDIGSPSRINYTVVGDVVNAAQRLESLGKEVDPDAASIVLVSGSTKNRLDETFATSLVGRFKVKGKQKELDVYRILFDANP